MRDSVRLQLSREEVPFDEMSWTAKREFLLDDCKRACQSCGYSKTRPDGKGILEIDHIDGDHTNNSKENLRVLCPNCHALTPNFRNWGRGSKKSSKRLRKGNTGYEDSRKNSLEERDKKRKEIEDLIVSVVLDTSSTGLIDYRKWGWIRRLNDLLSANHNLMLTQQTVGRKIKELMPIFYEQNCYKRI